MARAFIPLQVRFYDEALFERLKEIAQFENRSTNAQILEFIKQGIEKYTGVVPPVNNTPSPDQ